MDIGIRIPNRSLVATALLATGVVVGFGVARAAIPADADALTYSAVLVDNGVPLTGTHAIAVTLFPDASSTNALCTAFDQANATVTQGRFAAKLDATCVTALHANPSALVEVKVDDVVVGSRTAIGAVPFALEAGHASSADAAASVTGTIGPAQLSGGVLHSVRKDNANCVAGAETTDCACAAGEIAIGGGALMHGDSQVPPHGAGFVIESRPLITGEVSSVSGADVDQTWRSTCSDPTNVLTPCDETYVICAQVAL